MKMKGKMNAHYNSLPTRSARSSIHSSHAHGIHAHVARTISFFFLKRIKIPLFIQKKKPKFTHGLMA